MKIAGFTFIRNALVYDYPIVEAIQSILPICDQVYVAVGDSQDQTRELVSRIAPDKVIILDTKWDDTLREGGRVLAQETNKIFQYIPEDYDWCFYIQGDEVLHEEGYAPLLQKMKDYLSRTDIDGLLLSYRHFYGSYDYLGANTRWYRKEIRVIKNNKAIYSYKDAQGFRKKGNLKLCVAEVPAYMHHYGWVKEPVSMQKKKQDFNKLYHDDAWIQKNIVCADQFDYDAIDALLPFEGTHPRVMQSRIEQKNWKFTRDPSMNKMACKHRFKLWVEKWTGYRPGEYKNYILVK
jgi:hypothetical protein